MKLGTQLHVGRKAPTAAELKPVAGDMGWKPVGGFWTSSLTDEGISDWIRWCRDEAGWDASLSWRLEPVEARIYVIDGKESLIHLLSTYGAADDLHSSYRRRLLDRRVANWAALAEDYDALHLTEDALWELRMKSMFIYGWDCESTVWFRWCFDNEAGERYVVPTGVHDKEESHV